jgi:hypothetical protein
LVESTSRDVDPQSQYVAATDAAPTKRLAPI